MLRAQTQGERDLLGSFCFEPLQVVKIGSCLMLVKEKEINVGSFAESLGDRESVGKNCGRFGENLPSVPSGGIEEEGSPAGGSD